MFDRTPVRSCTPSRRQNHDTFEQMFECVSGKGYRQATEQHQDRQIKTTRRGEVMSPRDAEGSGPLAGVSDFPDGPPDETGLTPRQHRVLDVIRDSVERRGYPPSMREIGEQVGLTSTSSVAHQLTTLQKKGYLRRDPNRPRAVEVRIPGEVAGDPDFDRARTIRVAAQVALLLQGRQLVSDAGGGGQPDLFTDLAHARRVAAP